MANTTEATTTNRTVTADTLVTVTMLGGHGAYQFGGPAKLASWCNTLSDLTGYQADFLVETLATKLATQYGMELRPVGLALAPLRFLVTLTASRAAQQLDARPHQFAPIPVPASGR